MIAFLFDEVNEAHTSEFLGVFSFRRACSRFLILFGGNAPCIRPRFDTGGHGSRHVHPFRRAE